MVGFDLFCRLDARNRENVTLAGLGIRTSADIFEAAQRQYEEARGERNPVWRGTVEASALAGLGIRTLADILEATQGSANKRGREESSSRGRGTRKSRVVSSGQIAGAADEVAEHRVPVVGPSRQAGRKRAGPGSTDQPALKRTRTVGRRERDDEEQARDLPSVLRALEEEFAEKERQSHGHGWCAPIPQDRKASTVREFL